MSLLRNRPDGYCDGYFRSMMIILAGSVSLLGYGQEDRVAVDYA